MARLIVKKAGVTEYSFDITSAPVSIGREVGNDVVLADSSVSRRHARIERGPSGYTIVDLDSGNGVKHRGRRVPRLELYPGCELVVGVYTLVFEDQEAAAESTALMPGAKLVVIGGGAQREHPLLPGETVVGRSSASHVQIDDPLASKAHCKIVRQGSIWALVDLGSQNGTLLNGTRVTETELHHGDQIQIGGLTLYFSETGEVPAPGGIALIQAAQSPALPAPSGPTVPMPAVAGAVPEPRPARRSLFGSLPRGLVLGGGALLIVLILTLAILIRSPEQSTQEEFQKVFQTDLSEQARKQVQSYLEEARKQKQSGNLPLALEQYQKILVLDSNHQEAQEETARIDEELRKQAEARAEAEREARERAARAAALVARGDQLLSGGDFAGARKSYEEAMAVRPDDSSARAKLVGAFVAEGEAYRKKGQSAEATAAYQQALARDPENAGAKNGLNQMAASARQARERQERIRTLTEEGLAQLKNEEYAKAYASFAAVVQLSPGDTRARDFREQARELLAKQVHPIYEEGVRLYNEGKLAESVARFNRVLSLYRDHGETHSFLAKAKDRLREEAIETYKRAYIYEGLGRLKEALDLYRKTLELLPDPREEYHQKAAERVERLQGKVR